MHGKGSSIIGDLVVDARVEISYRCEISKEHVDIGAFALFVSFASDEAIRRCQFVHFFRLCEFVYTNSYFFVNSFVFGDTTRISRDYTNWYKTVLCNRKKV